MKKKMFAPGSKYGMLEVLKDDGGKTVRCRCDCGNVKDVPRRSVGRALSCGCKRDGVVAHNANMVKVYSGTRAVQKRNPLGITGVSREKSGKYRAYIGVNYKQVYLGVYNNINDAIRARKEAEEKLYKPMLEHQAS